MAPASSDQVSPPGQSTKPASRPTRPVDQPDGTGPRSDASPGRPRYQGHFPVRRHSPPRPAGAPAPPPPGAPPSGSRRQARTSRSGTPWRLPTPLNSSAGGVCQQLFPPPDGDPPHFSHPFFLFLIRLIFPYFACCILIFFPPSLTRACFLFGLLSLCHCGSAVPLWGFALSMVVEWPSLQVGGSCVRVKSCRERMGNLRPGPCLSGCRRISIIGVRKERSQTARTELRASGTGFGPHMPRPASRNPTIPEELPV